MARNLPPSEVDVECALAEGCNCWSLSVPGNLQEIEGFLDDDDNDVEDSDDEEEEDEDGPAPLIDDSMLDFMPNEDGGFAPTVREPWRSDRELKRVKGRAKKGGRKMTRRQR